MDNVTHSVAGLVLAESMARLRARGTGDELPARFGATAAITSMIAANLPDADLFYSGIGGNRLRYMLRVNPVFLWAYWLWWSVPIAVGTWMYFRDGGRVWERTEKTDAIHELVRDVVSREE